MPRPLDASATYRPGLDGVRAIAVLAVLGYHFGVPWLGGGLLGVSVFFTLSGFLITGILMSTWERSGGTSLGLGTFWVRRARRLLPALVIVLVVVLAATALADPDALRERFREAVAASFYVSNWLTIASEVSYFQRFEAPSPFSHLWSLAIEEQFYLVWPVLLLVMLSALRLSRRRIVLVTFVLAAVSFALLAWLATPGFDNTRAYEGTDTRAGELLVGAAFAMIFRPWAVRGNLPVRGRVLTDAAGLAALGVVGWLVVNTTEYSMSLYNGGLVALSLATAVLVTVVSRPDSLLGRVLGVAPMRWIGERSYGIYLWHMPLVAFMPASVLDSRPWVARAFLLYLTLILATLSWHFVEDPVRRHGFLGAWGRRGLPTLSGQPAAESSWRVPRMLVGSLGLATFAIAVLAVIGVVAASEQSDLMSDDLSSMLSVPPPPSPAPTTGPDRANAQDPSPSKKPEPEPEPSDTGSEPRTSCTAVVHVGDSTSVGLMDPAYLPRAKDRVDAQYRRVGARRVGTDISGARSIVETYDGQPNAFEATKARVDDGYDGCWVFAMGTNDTANQYVGGVVSLDDRIEKVMDEVDGAPALWLTLKTLRTSGPWNDEQMQLWNDALLRATERYPNMRVYDWRAQAKDGWYISDGIHFTSVGYQERGHRLADALALAFPADGVPSSDPVVAPIEASARQSR